MAQLKSVSAINIAKDANEIYSVPDSTPYVKLTELILSNHTASNVVCKVSVYKSKSDQLVIIIPGLELFANQNQIISLSTCLNANDKIIVEPNISQAIDVLISCVEM